MAHRRHDAAGRGLARHDRHSPVWIHVTGTSWEVVVGGESTGAQPAFVQHPSAFPFWLQLGVQAYAAPAGAIAADTTIRFDDVVIDATP